MTPDPQVINSGLLMLILVIIADMRGRVIRLENHVFKTKGGN